MISIRSRRARILAAVLIAFALGSIGLAVAIVRAGALVFEIEEPSIPGGGFAIRVPAAVLWVAMPLVPDRALHGAGEDLERWGPAARAALDELARCPDFTLVTVDSHREHVDIRKRGRDLVIQVEDGKTSVRIRLPLGAARFVIRQLEKAA